MGIFSNYFRTVFIYQSNFDSFLLPSHFKSCISPGYTLHYKKDGVEWYHIPIIASSSKNRFTITGLESSTPYRIYITASNQYGNGEPSDITTVTTSMKGKMCKSAE